MNRDEILAKLRALKPELEREAHVSSIGIFGSVARNEAGPDSDIDVLVEFSRTPSLFRLVELEDRLSETLGAKVDLVMKLGLHPALRDAILQEVVNA